MPETNILSAGPGFIRPEADQGSLQAGAAAFKEGWARSVGGTALRAGGYLYLREMGKTPLSKETHEAKYKHAFAYDPAMTEEEGWARYRDHLSDSVREADMAGHSTVATAGSLAGSILSPDLLLFAAAPEIKIGAIGEQLAGKTGTSLLRAASGRMTAGSVVRSMAETSLSAGIENAALEPIIFGLDQFIGRKHGLDDTLMNVTAGFGLGALIGGGKAAYRHYAPDLRQSLARSALRASANGEHMDPLVGALASTDAAANRGAATAADLAGEQMKMDFDIPEDIVSMEGNSSLHDTGYTTPKDLDPRSKAQHEQLRELITTRNAERQFQPNARQEAQFRQKKFMEAARVASGDDELLLNEAFKRIFGTEVKYVDGDVAGDTALLGLFNAKEPGTIYVRSGSLDDNAGINMLRVAGHEMGHVIRARDPGLWLNMVDTMIDPVISRHFGESWKEVRSAKKSSNLWGEMTYHERMDETLSTVLGHAMQTPDFWVSLNKTAGADGRKLAGYLLKTYDTLAQIAKDRLGSFGGAKVHKMESQLAKAVTALTDSGQYKFASTKEAVSSWERALNKSGTPLGSDKKPIIYSGYLARREKFRNLEQRVYDDINAAGLREERRSAHIDNTLGHFFANEANLRDRSASPVSDKNVTVRTKAVKGDPRNYLIKVFYKNLPGADAQKAFNTLVTRTAQKYSEGRDFLNTAMEQGPLATYKHLGPDPKTGDPLYEFRIYHNDKSPTWSENRVADDFEIDDVKLAYKEHYDNIAAAFVEELPLTGKGEKTGLKGSVENLRQQTQGVEARAYMAKLTPSDIRQMSTQDLIDGFHRHLDEEMSMALAHADEKRYGSLADIRNEDAPAPETGGSEKMPKTLYQRVEEVRQTARNVFLINNREPFAPFDPDATYTHPDLKAGDVADGTLGEALDVLRSTMFAERLAMMKDDPELRFFYENMSDAQKDRYHTNLNQEIDRAIYDNHPNLRRVMSEETKNVLIGKETVPIMVNKDFILDSSNDILGDDANWRTSVDAMEMPLEEQLRLAADSIGKHKAESEAAVERTLKLLDETHKLYAPWLEDVSAAAQKDLPDLLKRNNLIDFEIEDRPLGADKAPIPKPERTIAEEKLHETIKSYKKSMRLAEKDLDNIAGRRQRERGKDAPETDYAYETYQRQLRFNPHDKQAALAASKADLKSYYVNRIRGEILAHEAGKTIMAKARKSFKHLYSWLDGQARAGVKDAGASVDSMRKAAVIGDMTPLDQVLARYGLRDHWLNNTLVEAVMNHIETGTGKTKEVKLIADTVRKIVDSQAGRINSHGGAYRMLDRYIFSQVHDAAKISGNRDAWTKYVMENNDWSKTEKFIGKMETDEAKARYLDAVYDLILAPADEGLDGVEKMPGNIMSQTSLRRTIHFKPGSAFKYDMTFGSGNTGAEIFSQIGRRAEKGAIMEAFGPKYKETWSESMTSLGVRLAGRFSDHRMADATFHQIIGTYDNPVDKGLATMGRAMRNVANSAALWMTGISSITDVGNIVSTLKWTGISPKDLHGKVINAIVEGARTESGRQALQAAGAGMQAQQGAYARIMGSGAFERLAQKMSDFTFKYSGTEITTKLYQEAMTDLLSEHFGSQGPKSHSPEFANWLEHYGISKDEWAQMAKFSATVEGLGDQVRLSPDLITDPKLSQKLRAAMFDTIGYGQLQSSVSDEALLRMSTKAGTYAGEAMRFVGQYKTYSLAVVNKTRARFRHAYGSLDAPVNGIIPLNKGTVEMLAWSSSMLVLAWTALSIKDVLRGNEPLNPFEKDHWTWGNFTRLMGQASSPMATIEQFASMQQVLGPVPGAAYRLGKAFSSDAPGSGYRKTEAVFGALPGASIGPLQAARRQMIAEFVSDAYKAQLDHANSFRQAKTGQEDLLDFRD